MAYDGGVYVKAEPERRVSIEAIGTKAEGGGTQQILSTATYISGLAPLTFMSGFAEIDLDPETGKLQLLRFVSVADCGKVLNPALARVQAEGGVLMGIGMALYSPQQDRDAAALLARADEAMYRVKQQGKNGYWLLE